MEHIDTRELYKKPPPPFGHALKKYFALDPEYVNLNNGSYGSAPTPVLQAANELSLKAELNPDRFMRLLYQPILVESREKIAKLIGAKTDECVLVANASMGINTVLRNFEWEEGDVIIVFSTTYGSVFKTAYSLSDASPHPTVSIFTIGFPSPHEQILSSFKEHVKALPKVTSKKTVAIIDSIISNPGVALPWKEMVKICKEEGIWSVIDAAHSIGQEVGINLAEADPDFWVSNCHKWLYAKRSCAVLYVPERNQHIIKTSIPTSHTYISPKDRKEPNFVSQFEWNGTIDFMPYLTVPAALEFREWLGGEEKLNAYCHDLALKGGARLAEVMGTQVLDPNGELTFNMVNVALPLPDSLHNTLEIDHKLKTKLLEERKVYSAHFYHNGRWWTRASAQVWNELEDFEKLGHAWVEVCKEVLEELGIKNEETKA